MQVYGAALALAIVGLVVVQAKSALAEKRTQYGPGGVTCGEWQQHRSTRNTAVFQLEAWVAGFLSGYNLASDIDFLAPKATEVAYYAWIDNYCRQNPLNRVSEAATALKDELISRKLP
jgi:hypothetical protein